MATVKHDSLRELRDIQERMGRVLELAWSRDPGEDGAKGEWQPPVDIFENERNVVIKAELPGVDQEDIEIRIEDTTLTICGVRRDAPEIGTDSHHRIESRYGPFRRSFSLPRTIDPEHARASCDKGVLTLILPKKDEESHRSITVKVD